MAERGKKQAAIEDASGGNINQIRDILVGPFQREQEARLSQLERTVERNSNDAESARKRLEDKLEKKIDKSVARLEGMVSDVGDDLKQAGKDLSSQIKDLEKLMDKQLKALRGELDAAVAQLRDEKTNRHDLGDYLMELGLRLKGEASLQSLESTLKDAGGDAKS